MRNPQLSTIDTGTGFIAVGATVVFVLRAGYGLGCFVAMGGNYPDPALTLVAWVVLLVIVAVTIIGTRATSNQLPDWAFTTFLLGLGLVIMLDLVSIWSLHDIGGTATASATAGTALLLILTVRPTRDIVISTVGVGAVMVTAIILNAPLTAQNAGAQILSVTLTVVPIIIGVIVVRGFRQLMQVTLDRVFVQSTISEPRLAVGMMASDELARLDLAAERLLDSVAQGTVPLPLGPGTASLAASLATELRLHLIEGRRETWLHHAITESDMLGRAVSLSDRSSLASLLNSQQREGLLGTVWLLVSENGKVSSHRPVTIIISPSTESVLLAAGRNTSIHIIIEATRPPRSRVDPSIRDSLGRLGDYS
jgi:hypothetical protein